MIRRHFRRGLGRQLVAACALSASMLSAQGPPIDSVKKAKQPLFTISDAAIAVGFVGLTYALYPADKSMAERLQQQNKVATKTIDHLATGFDYATLPGVLIASAGTYAWGRIAKQPTVADFGWHTTEAVLLGMTVSGIVKGLAGRSRPFVTADTNPRDWKFGAGITSDARSSFPSGHTTIAFAAASAATSEINRLWPKYSWAWGTALYASAGMVGLARMYHNQHWASDVVVGAGIGTLTGLKTVRYSHLHPDNFLDRMLLHTPATPAPGGGGALSWSASFR